VEAGQLGSVPVKTDTVRGGINWKATGQISLNKVVNYKASPPMMLFGA